MRLSKIRVKNFRAARDVELTIGNQMTLIGGNGVGKSCVLKAVERFFGKSTAVSEDDFFQRNTEDPIEIALTFSSFSEGEAEVFASRIHGNELHVARVFRSDAAKDNGKYFGLTDKHVPFDAVRLADGATNARREYNALRENEKYSDLPAVRAAGDIEEHLLSWENEHPEECDLDRDAGQFQGFTNVFRGSFNKHVSFVFVPAVKDAKDDVIDSKNSAIGQLLELLVKSVLEQRRDIVEFKERSTAEYEKLTSKENLKELDALSGDLTETLEVYYEDTAIDLEWQPIEPFSVPLPTADVLITEQGFRGPIGGKGHGLQRALIFTLLQHLASVSNGDEPDNAEADSALNEDGRSLILAIEEPELYQHPTKQRHLSRVLSEISDGKHKGVLANTQIIACSHSPYFISTDKFDQIGLANRIIDDPDVGPECKVRSVSYQDISEKLAAVWDADPEQYTIDALKARLHILNTRVAEGFFANLALIVEGKSDWAAITAAAELAKVDFEAKGIAVLPVGGKSNIDRVALIFRELGIPTYLVWDCDNDKADEADKKVEANKALQRICGVEKPENILETVNDQFACFEECLEMKLIQEIPELDDFVQQSGHVYGISGRKKILKNPVAMASVLQLAATAGQKSQFLDDIISKAAAQVA